MKVGLCPQAFALGKCQMTLHVDGCWCAVHYIHDENKVTSEKCVYVYRFSLCLLVVLVMTPLFEMLFFTNYGNGLDCTQSTLERQTDS